MARMKRFLLLALILLFLPISRPAVGGQRRAASADELRYAVAADSNVWFYTAESESARLFLLPETYYVRVLFEGEVYTAVEYLVNDDPYRKIMGYCRTDAITPVSFIPARPFLKKIVSVTYTIPDNGGFGDEDFYDIRKTFVYYGKRYENGQLYLYVLSEGKFGFIPADIEPEFERNDDYLTVPSGPASSDKEPSSSDMGGTSTVQIVAICLASAAAIAIAVLVVRGKRRPPAPPEDE